MPARQLSTRQAGFHTVQHGRAIEIVTGVLFTGPDDLNRPSDPIGHCRRFFDIVLSQSTAKTAAEKGRIDSDIVGAKIGHPGCCYPAKVRRLCRGPHLHAVLSVPGRGIHGLQCRVGQVGLGIFRFHHPVALLHGTGKTALTTLGLSGIVIGGGAVGVEHVARRQRHGIRKIPVYLERVLSLPGTPVFVGNNGHATLDLKNIKHTRHCTDLISVEVPNAAAASGRA